MSSEAPDVSRMAPKVPATQVQPKADHAKSSPPSAHIHASNHPTSETDLKTVTDVTRHTDVFKTTDAPRSNSLQKRHVSSRSDALASQQNKTNEVTTSAWIKATPGKWPKAAPSQKDARVENKIYDTVPQLPPELDACQEATEKFVAMQRDFKETAETAETILTKIHAKVQTKMAEYEEAKTNFKACKNEKWDRRDPYARPARELKIENAKQKIQDAKQGLMEAKHLLSVVQKENKQRLAKCNELSKQCEKQAIHTLKVYESQCKTVLTKVNNSEKPNNDSHLFFESIIDLMETFNKNLLPHNSEQLAPYQISLLNQLDRLHQVLKAPPSNADVPAAVAPTNNQALAAANASEWDTFLDDFAHPPTKRAEIEPEIEDLQARKSSLRAEIDNKKEKLNALLWEEYNDSQVIEELKKEISKLEADYKTNE